MSINGLSTNASQIFEDVSKLDCIKDYCLIGGTALAIQIGHRLSEDLDFCVWKKHRQHKPEVRWNVIFDELSTLGKVQKNIFDLSHCDFHVNGVKITFFYNTKEPENMQKKTVLNNIVVADPVSIGVMKLEVMMFRTAHRDYYDIYSLLRKGIDLETLISRARKYLKHSMKTREILSMLADRANLKDEKSFSQLMPKYDVSINDIKEFIVENIKSL